MKLPLRFHASSPLCSLHFVDYCQIKILPNSTDICYNSIVTDRITNLYRQIRRFQRKNCHAFRAKVSGNKKQEMSL
nr:MAG TPA: hypothetical protein [Caudoviricetes sp.]